MFNNSVGETIQFDQNGELVTAFDVTNWVTFSNGSFARVKVGRLAPHAPSDEQLTLLDELIVWHRSFNQVRHRECCFIFSSFFSGVEFFKKLKLTLFCPSAFSYYALIDCNICSPLNLS